MDAHTESGIIHPRGIVETIPFGDDLVTITANTERLKLDILNEAKKRPGVNLQKAEKISKNLKFYFSAEGLRNHEVTDLKRKGLDNPIWKLVGYAEKAISPAVTAVENLRLRGTYYPEENAPALFINPKTWARIASNLKTSPDNQKLFIAEQFDSVWRHEREHILRSIDPQTEKSDNKIKYFRAATSFTTFSTVSYICLNYELDIPANIPNYETLRAVKLLSLFALPYMTSGTVREAWYTFDPAEKAAADQFKNGNNLSRLFDFNFEKSNKYKQGP